MVAEAVDYRRSRALAKILAITVSSAVTAWLVGIAVSSVAHNKMAHWLLGRAAGVTSYLLIVALVIMGLLLSHPAGSRLRRIPGRRCYRVHVSLAVFTLAFTALHILVLASDPYAGVGWRGAVVPGLAVYRPLPVTLGVIGLYAGLLAGITAATAGRVIGKVWWPIHKVAIVSLILVWLHGLLAGSDTTALLIMYAVTGLAVVVLAISRYTARTRGDHLRGLLHETERVGATR